MSEPVFHLVCIRVNAKTGARVGTYEERLTSYPMPHDRCLVMRSKFTPRRPYRGVLAAIVLREVMEGS